MTRRIIGLLVLLLSLYPSFALAEKGIAEQVRELIQEMSCQFYQEAKARVMSDLDGSSTVESEGEVYGYWIPGIEVSTDRMEVKLYPKMWFSRKIGLDEDWDVETMWDQAYVAFDLGRSRIGIGWQKYTWGKLDKIEFLDMVNPYDLRWFYTWEKDERKESLLSLSWQWDGDNWWLDVVAVPRLGRNRCLYFNSDWAHFGRIKETFSSYPEVQDIEVVTPDWVDSYSLKNSELFLRWGSALGGLDFDLYFMYGYNRVPELDGSSTVKRFLYRPSAGSLLALLGTSAGERKLVRVYRRDITLGADFETTIGEFGVRGELGYSRDVPVSKDDYSLVFKDQAAVGIGIDYTSPNNWYFNLQLIWQTVLDYPGLLTMERDSFVWVANVRKDLLDGDLILDVDLLLRMPYEDWMFNPELSYRLNSFSKLVIGGFWFNGPGTTLFGAKREDDRVYTELELRF